VVVQRFLRNSYRGIKSTRKLERQENNMCRSSTSHVILLTLQHVAVGIVSDGEQMRRHFGSPLAAVLVHNVLPVDRQAFVRIDGDAEQARIGLQRKY